MKVIGKGKKKWHSWTTAELTAHWLRLPVSLGAGRVLCNIVKHAWKIWALREPLLSKLIIDLYRHALLFIYLTQREAFYGLCCLETLNVDNMIEGESIRIVGYLNLSMLCCRAGEPLGWPIFLIIPYYFLTGDGGTAVMHYLEGHKNRKKQSVIISDLKDMVTQIIKIIIFFYCGSGKAIASDHYFFYYGSDKLHLNWIPYHNFLLSLP